MTGRVTFGIDPGMAGAVATLIDGEPGPLLDMPTMAVGDKTEVDAAALARFIRDVRRANDGAYFCATIERVRAMPPRQVGGVERRPGAQSSMNFGESYGKAKAVLEVFGLDFSLAEPQSWKRHFGLIGQEKDASRQLALRRFPSMASLLKRKKDDGRAEALLLALWHEQKHLTGTARAA
jgi:crossover junction endodeoxyribonuclease RuvC